MPRFEAGAYAANLELLDEFSTLAASAQLSMAQLALAWILGRGEHIVAIPGTTSRAHLTENHGGDAPLPPDLIQRLDVLFDRRRIVGARYNAAAQRDVDTEQFEA